MPYAPANIGDGSSGIFFELGRTVSGGPTSVRLTHIGRPTSPNFSSRTRSTESSVPQSVYTTSCRLPTDDLKYDHPRRSQPRVLSYRKIHFQFVAQVGLVHTR